MHVPNCDCRISLFANSLFSWGIIIGIIVGLRSQSAFSNEQSSMKLVDRRQPVATIVISDEASEVLLSAVEDLQHYLKTMSGAELPIARASEIPKLKGNVILIGRIKPVNELIPDLDRRDLGPDGFIIKTLEDKLVLTGISDGRIHENYAFEGRTDCGTPNAIYYFLESLGCRWYMPGEEGEVIPQLDTIEVPFQELNLKPDFSGRHLGIGAVVELGHRQTKAYERGDPSLWGRDHNIFKEFSMWLARNRASANTYRHGHSMDYLFPRDQFAAAHPEYYALVEGKRRASDGQPCLSNPLVENAIVTSLLEKMSTQAPWRSYPVGQSDTSLWCQCDDCRAEYGAKTFTYNEREALVVGGDPANIARPNIANGYLKFVNRLADEVKKVQPDCLLTYYAVYNIPGFPEVAPRDNVMPGMCHIEPSNATWCAEVREWEAISKQLHYYTYMGWRLDRPKLGIAEDLRWCRNHKGIAVYLELDTYSPINMVPMYLAAKILWDADADEDTILDEFYRTYYGASAAEPMRGFFETFDQATKKGSSNYSDCMYEYPATSPTDGPGAKPYQWVAECRRQIDKAQSVTQATQPLESRRIDDVSRYWRAVEFFVEAQQALDGWHAGKTAEAGHQVRKAVQRATEYIRAVGDDFHLDHRVYLLDEMVRTVEKG